MKRRALLFLILFNIPWFLLWEGVQSFCQTKSESLRNETNRKLEKCLSRFSPLGDAETVLNQSLRKIVSRAKLRKNPFSFISKKAELLQARYPGLFSWIVFDESNKVKFDLYNQSRPGIGERLLKDLRKVYSVPYGRGNVTEFLAPKKNLYEQFLDGSGVINKFDFPKGWFQISSRPRNSWFFYDLNPRFSIFVFVHRQGFPHGEGLKLKTVRWNDPEIHVDLFDIDRGRSIRSGNSVQAKDSAHIYKRFEDEAKMRFLDMGRVWQVMPVDGSTRILVSTIDKAPIFVFRLLFLFFQLAFLANILFSALLFSILESPARKGFSIRFKVLGLFLLATCVPLFLLASIALAYSQERRTNLIHKAWREGEETLRVFETNLDVARRISRNAILRLLRENLSTNEDDFNRFYASLKEFSRKFNVRFIQIFHSSGKNVFSWPRTGDAGKSFSKLTGEVMVEVLRAYNHEESGKINSSVLKTEMLMESLGGEAGGKMIQNFVGQLGQLISHDLGKTKSLIFFDVLHFGKRKPGHILVLGWNLEDFFRYYLRNFLPQKPLSDESEWFASLLAPEMVWASMPKDSLPRIRSIFPLFPAKPVDRHLLAVFKECRKSGRLLNRIIRFRGKPSLLTIMPGLVLRDVILFHTRPLNSIEEELSGFRQRTFVMGAVYLLFTMILGYLLAGSFLEPIRNISMGITAIKNKRFDEKVQVISGDELGDLSNLMNQMLESLRELDVGKEVQENLFPREPLILGNIRIDGFSKTASELGGDYYDFFQVGETHLVALVGDVTGHGIPAALIMAMSKALVFSASHQTTDPMKILELLNSNIHALAKKGMTMTMGFYWVDTVSGEITFMNCGHIYPLKIAPEKDIEVISGAGFAIGMRPVLRTKPIKFTLNPKERLIVYTDGLGETFKPEGDFTGFDLLRLWLAQQPFINSEKICREMILKHPHILAGGLQADDFTVVTIDRI